MYQSLLPIVKPLVFEGKSGTLQVMHKYNDQAQLFVKEGIIEQVKTKKLQGKKAVATCARWVNITTSFQEGKQGDYTPDPEIDTNDFLSFLEKSSKNIEIIQKKISDDDAVFQIDSNKLNNAKKLGAEDLKIALLFDGKRSIEQVLPLAGKSELAVLTHTCRLIISGVAQQASSKDVIPDQEREEFLQALEEKLTDLVGPAGPILAEDALSTIGSRPDMLAQDEIGPLLSAIGTMLEDEEKVILDKWGAQFL
jgi:hypothetical protein